MSKHLNHLSLALVALLTMGIMSFRILSAGDPPVKITAQELNSISFEKFIQAGSEYSVESCTVTVAVEKEDIRNFSINGATLPKELKQYFASVTPGETITVHTRLATVNGKTKKLPAVVYAVVEKH